MESFEEYINGLKKEKEERQKERQEEDIIDGIADKMVKKLQEKLYPAVPYCPLDCPYYFYYPHCPYYFYHPYYPYCPRHTCTITWIYPITTYSRIPQTYSIDPTDASKTHTYDSWGYREGEKDE